MPEVQIALLFLFFFRFNNVKYLQHHLVLFYVLVCKKTKHCRIFLFRLIDVAFRNKRRLTCTSYFCSKSLLLFITLLSFKYHTDRDRCRRLVNINNLRERDFPGRGLEGEENWNVSIYILPLASCFQFFRGCAGLCITNLNLRVFQLFSYKSDKSTWREA